MLKEYIQLNSEGEGLDWMIKKHSKRKGIAIFLVIPGLSLFIHTHPSLKSIQIRL